MIKKLILIYNSCLNIYKYDFHNLIISFEKPWVHENVLLNVINNNIIILSHNMFYKSKSMSEVYVIDIKYSFMFI